MKTAFEKLLMGLDEVESFLAREKGDSNGSGYRIKATKSPTKAAKAGRRQQPVPSGKPIRQP